MPDRASLVQQLSGYHWASGLFLPVSFAADLARGRPGVLEALDTWAENADALEQRTIEVFRRLTSAYERGFAVHGDPLPSLPHVPMVGADAWTAAEVEVARREDSRVNVQRGDSIS